MIIRPLVLLDMPTVRDYEAQEASNRSDGNFFSAKIWFNTIGNQEVLGAFDDKILVGFLRFITTEDKFSVLYLHVSCSKRRQGIGENLLNVALKIADENLLASRLSVSPKNKGAQRLYQNFGFVAESIKEDQIEAVTSIEMRRPVNTPEI